MTREEAYRQGMAEGGYTPEQVDYLIESISEIAKKHNAEPFSGPDWKALDDYIKRKTGTTCQKTKQEKTS